MIKKIKDALKTEYSNLGLGEKAFDGVAEFYSKTITEESQIEEAIKGAKPLLKAIQGEADRVRTDSQSKKTELETKIEELQGELKKLSTKEPNKEGAEDDDKMQRIEELEQRIEELVNKQSQADKSYGEKVLKGKVKEKMIEDGIKPKVCDEILSTVTISETDTEDSIYDVSVSKFNVFKTELTPEANSIQQPQSDEEKESVMDEYWSKVKADNELNKKNREDVIRQN